MCKSAESRKGNFFGLQKIGAKKIPEHVRSHNLTELEKANGTLLLATLPTSRPCRTKYMSFLSCNLYSSMQFAWCLSDKQVPSFTEKWKR